MPNLPLPKIQDLLQPTQEELRRKRAQEEEEEDSGEEPEAQ